jgi:hypothetical protein
LEAVGRSPVLALSSYAELLNLALRRREHFSSCTEVEQLGFGQFVEVLDWLRLLIKQEYVGRIMLVNYFLVDVCGSQSKWMVACSSECLTGLALVRPTKQTVQAIEHKTRTSSGRRNGSRKVHKKRTLSKTVFIRVIATSVF